MRIDVDRQRCCSSGLCVMTAPDVFDQSEDEGVVLLLDAAPPAEFHADVRLAARACPGGAITAHE